MHRSRRRGSGQRPSERQGGDTVPDEQLVALALAGDDDAFERLFDRHVGDAFRTARDALGSEAEAEEAVCHSFAAARAYLAARDCDIEFGPWLRTILANHCLSMLHERAAPPRRAGATVVDLGEWRRRRGRLGIALPMPLVGARETLLGLCGLGGGGAAATGAAGGGSLVAGTVAKVAVAALLAGGVGAAGQAVVEREAPARAAGPDAAAQVRLAATRAGPLAPAAAALADPLERAVERARARRLAAAQERLAPPSATEAPPIARTVPPVARTAPPAPRVVPPVPVGAPLVLARPLVAPPSAPAGSEGHVHVPAPRIVEAVTETGRALLEEVEWVGGEELLPAAEPPPAVEVPLPVVEAPAVEAPVVEVPLPVVEAPAVEVPPPVEAPRPAVEPPTAAEPPPAPVVDGAGGIGDDP